MKFSFMLFIILCTFPQSAFSEGLYEYRRGEMEKLKSGYLKALQDQRYSEDEKKDMREMLKMTEGDLQSLGKDKEKELREIPELIAKIDGRPVGEDTASLYDDLVHAFLVQDMNNCDRYMDTMQKLKAYEYHRNPMNCYEYQGNARGVFWETYAGIQEEREKKGHSDMYSRNYLHGACWTFRNSPQYAAYTLTEQAEAEDELKDVCPAD